VSLTWLAGAGILALASCVFGLAGFGLGLVALALLPFLLPPTLAVPLVSLYSAVFGLVLTLQVRLDLMAAPLAALLSGALVGTPVGVWGLATLPASGLRRLIGGILMGVVLIEWRDLYPRTVSGRAWGSRPASSPGCSAGRSAPQGHRSFCTPPRKGGHRVP
jgi:uncharacterized membrane protein YfcA